MIITIQNKRKYKISLFRLWQVFFSLFAVLLITFIPTILFTLQLITSSDILALIMNTIIFFFFAPFIQLFWFFAIYAATHKKKPFFTAFSDEFEEILQKWGEKIE